MSDEERLAEIRALWDRQFTRAQELLAEVVRLHAALAAETERCWRLLEAYLSHDSDCDTRSRPNFGGPYVCTCGLESAIVEVKIAAKIREGAPK